VHAGFISLSIAYAFAEWVSADDSGVMDRSRPALFASIGTALLVLVAAVIAALAFADRLPHVIAGNAFTPFLRFGAAPALACGYFVAIGALVFLTRLRTTTQLWVLVVLAALA
jgi:hypothetical protein